MALPSRAIINRRRQGRPDLVPPTSLQTAPAAAGPRRPWRAPALRAALIQALAAGPAFGILVALAHAHHPFSLVGAALVQGVLATLLTTRSGLAPWWRPIQLVFPVALLGADALHLPPAAAFGIFVFLVLLFWSTFRTQVPFYPSGPAVWKAVATLVPADEPVRLIDIGSGLGGLVLDLARRFPAARSSGIELAPLPWFFSVVRARLTGSSARFVRGDYERLDFATYDVVFAYLSPAAMSALWHKAVREMRPGALLVSYEFDIPAKAPDRIITTTATGPALYVWSF